MRLAAALFLCVSMATNVLAIGPEVSFQWSGGRSRIAQVNIEINSSGKVRAIIKVQKAEARTYETALNEFESTYLTRIIATSDLANLPRPELPPLEDQGKTTLTVKTESLQTKATYVHIARLQPLEQFFWQIATQADLADAATGNDRVYELLGAVDPRLGSAKVLQPYVFRQPLIDSLKRQTEFQQLAWRLQALSCITSPTEFAGIVAPHLDHANLEKWRLWLTSLSTHECYGNLRQEYLLALFPLLEGEMRNFGEKAKTRETPEGEAFARFRALFKEYHYATD